MFLKFIRISSIFLKFFSIITFLGSGVESRVEELLAGTDDSAASAGRFGRTPLHKAAYRYDFFGFNGNKKGICAYAITKMIF